MYKIEIKNFKAFGGRLAINPTTAHKNVLIYGENGAGKTSLYEAIMLAFYREKMLRPHLSVGAPAEQRANEEKDFYNGYNHKTEAGTPEIDFTIKINNGDLNTICSQQFRRVFSV